MDKLYKERSDLDVYDKMAEFLVCNDLYDCRFCKAIEMSGSNNCCDDEKECINGIAMYLRKMKILG